MFNTNQDSPERDPLAEKWNTRLEPIIKRHDARLREKAKAWREVLKGSDEKSDEMRLLFSVFSSLIPQVYAKDPEIDVDPTEMVRGSEMYAQVRDLCQAIKLVLERQLVVDAKLKKRCKAVLRAAMTTGLGWVKVVYQRDYTRDPIIDQRINDTQDNLQRINTLIEQLEEPNSDYDTARAELVQALESLEAQVEVVAAEGMVIDRPLSEDIIVCDETLTEFDDYIRADAIAHRIWMTTERYREVFGRDPGPTASYYGTATRQAESKADKGEQLLAVLEIWSRRDNTVYTLCQGEKVWSREPYVPERQGQRWYPFFALAFNLIDGQFQPLSDVHLLEALQDEYNETRQKYRELREDIRPGMAYRRTGGLDDEDVANIQNRRSGDAIGVGGDPDRPLAHDLQEIPAPRIDPGLYDTRAIHQDIEMLSGGTDASRNVTNTAKTATEAEIMAASMQGRMGERVDTLEDFISEIAQYTTEVLLLETTPMQAAQIAGPAALQVWPQMARQEIYNLYRCQVRGGTTVRQSRAREREQWVQLLPVIQNNLIQIAELRQTQNPMSEVAEFILEQTLKRFDERFDLSEFLPQQPMQPMLPPGLPGMPPAPQQQVAAPGQTMPIPQTLAP